MQIKMGDLALHEKMSWPEVVEHILEKVDNPTKEFKTFLLNQRVKKYMFSPQVYFRCWQIYKNIRQDKDHFIVISGQEGSGKSHFALQIASVIDPDFSLDRLFYTPEPYLRSLKKSNPYEGYILDEGNIFLFGREAMSASNKNLVKLFATLRQKNLLTIICLPLFWSVESYVREHRTNTLFQLNHKKRGAGLMIPFKTAINIISYHGKVTKTIPFDKLPGGSVIPINFNKHLPHNLSWSDYSQKKKDSFDNMLDTMIDEIKPEDTKAFFSVKEASQILGIHRDTVLCYIKSGKLPSKNIAGKHLIPKRALNLKEE